MGPLVRLYLKAHNSSEKRQCAPFRVTMGYYYDALQAQVLWLAKRDVHPQRKVAYMTPYNKTRSSTFQAATTAKLSAS